MLPPRYTQVTVPVPRLADEGRYMKWAETNCSGKFYLLDIKSGKRSHLFNYAFELEEDAALFKLHFG